jgi:hypothetical protein
MFRTELTLQSTGALLTALWAIVAVGTAVAQAPSVTYTTYPGIPGFGFSGFTAGADEALWFSGFSVVGKITTSGVITQGCGFHAGQIPRDLLQQAVDILPVRGRRHGKDGD